MKQGTLASAARVVRQLTAAVVDLRAARDAYEQERRWNAFLTIANTFYLRFEGGIRENTASVAEVEWLQRLQKDRDDDPLLEYLEHARDDFVHGKAPVGNVGQHTRVNLTVLEAYNSLPDPKPHWGDFVLNHPDTIKEPLAVKLRPVERRGPRRRGKPAKTGLVYPPLEHMGVLHFSLDPTILATIALGYFTAKLREAEGLAPD